MSARVLVIGFDACEASLVRRWAAEGKLPNFAALVRASRTFQLDNPMETLPGAIWPEIHTGCSSGKMGHFYIPNQLHTGEAVLRKRSSRTTSIRSSITGRRRAAPASAWLSSIRCKPSPRAASTAFS
jgi:predicted AlkP superfamily phosphohydrolase/phosphomutase